MIKIKFYEQFLPPLYIFYYVTVLKKREYGFRKRQTTLLRSINFNFLRIDNANIRFEFTTNPSSFENTIQPRIHREVKYAFFKKVKTN